MSADDLESSCLPVCFVVCFVCLHNYSSVKQRAAIARALITKPQLILADEPSGALDSKAADSLMNLFTTINQEGQTIVMVTHSVKAASSAKRVLFIKDGKVFHQLYRGNLTNEEMYERISDTLKILTTGGEEDE